VKRPLVDLNVVLDALLTRPPQAQAAARLWAAAERGRIAAFVPAHGVTTLFYLVKQGKGAAAARRAVTTVLSVFGVAPADQAVLQRALSLGWADFEDAVCAAAAEAAGCDVIVTGDPRGFRGSAIPAVDAATALSLLEGGGPETVAESARPYRRASRRAPR
jgi:predicted nucleic acid-binding protein